MKKGTTFKRNLWTADEIEWLKEIYPDRPTEEVCKMMDRTPGSINSKALELGLKKSEAYMNTMLERVQKNLTESGKMYRYPKGHTPANKGKKMSKELYAKCSKTMFKKGNVPHNTRSDGETQLRSDGYWYVRVSKGKWDLRHRVLWRKHHGAITSKDIIKFKDGNTNNITIENLYKTDRVGNMADNTIQRYPPELQSTIRVIKKLEKSIQNATK